MGLSRPLIVQCGANNSSRARLDWWIPMVVTFCWLPFCSHWFSRPTCGYAMLSQPSFSALCRFWLQNFTRFHGANLPLKPILASYISCSIGKLPMGFPHLASCAFRILSCPIYNDWQWRRQPVLGSLLNMLKNVLDGVKPKCHRAHHSSDEMAEAQVGSMYHLTMSCGSMRAPAKT